MTAADLLTEARADGVTLALDPPDRLKLRGDPEAVARWAPLLRPHKPELLDLLRDPRPALYRRWLDGITEPRALLTLDPAQVREAIAAGAVSRELAAGAVLVLVRAPAGDLGPGAVGLLAIPKARYAGFSPLAAVEALGAIH